MSPRPRFRPTLEQFEELICPAYSLMVRSGVMTISGSPFDTAAPVPGFTKGLRITQTAPGVLNVTEFDTFLGTSFDFGTYLANGGLRLSLTNHQGNRIEVDLNDFTYPASISMNLGRGDLTSQEVVLFGGPTGTGVVAGSLTFQGGSGREELVLGTTDAIAGELPVSVSGNVFVTGNPSAPGIVADSLLVHPGSLLGGSLIAHGLENLAIGLIADPALVFFPVRVNGDVVVGPTGNTGDVTVGLSQVQLGGSLTVVGNSSPGLPAGDSVVLEDGTTVGGNVTLALGEGLNTLLFGFFDDFGPPTIGGNLSYVGGGGTDNLFLFGAVQGSVSLFLGNGTNTIDTFGGFGIGGPTALAVDGSMTVLGGNGTDSFADLDGQGPPGFAGLVGGSLTINFANGANTFRFEGDLGASVGGSVSYSGGSGVDLVQISGVNGFPLTVNLGAGADIFEYLTLGTRVGSAVIDFGVDFDVDMYLFPVGFTVDWNQTLRNLP